jgi:hypothetical protein
MAYFLSTMDTRCILKSAETPKEFPLFFCMAGLAAAAVQNTANFLIPISAEQSSSIKEAAVAVPLRICYSKTTPHI